MDTLKTYQNMLRDIVRDQGDPENFRANAVRLTDAQLAVALTEYDDTEVEIVGEMKEQLRLCLRDPNNSFVQMLRSRNAYEAIGYSLVAGCRNRVMREVRRDLELKAAEMAAEDRLDAEAEHA